MHVMKHHKTVHAAILNHDIKGGHACLNHLGSWCYIGKDKQVTVPPTLLLALASS